MELDIKFRCHRPYMVVMKAILNHLFQQTSVDSHNIEDVLWTRSSATELHKTRPGLLPLSVPGWRIFTVQTISQSLIVDDDCGIRK